MSTNWDWGIFQCPQDWIGVKIYVHIYGYIIIRMKVSIKVGAESAPKITKWGQKAPPK